MKKLVVVLLVVILAVAVVGCQKDDGQTLSFYNWGEYIDPEVIEEFEAETGIKVIYENFEQNEDMYTKIKDGGSTYDLVIPSDYMIERMIREELVQPIDVSKLSNYKNIGEQYKNMEYDPTNEYSVPYFWGTVGILYNKNEVKDAVDSWDILWDEKYSGEIIMMNSTRDSIGIALKKLGYSMNSRDDAQLQEAKQELLNQKPLVAAYLVDEMKSQMVNEEALLAPAYSGDAIVAIDENENLGYAIPKDGTNLWFDAMVIPSNAKNVEAAHQMIDFLLRPEIAVKNADFVGYSLPNTAGIELLDDEMKNSPVAYPDLSSLQGLEVFKDPSDILEKYDEIWAEVKAE